MTDKEEVQLPFGWTQKPHPNKIFPGHVNLYDRHGRHQICLPKGIDLRDCVLESVGRETGLSREVLEMAILCSENLDTQQPRMLFESAKFRVVRIAGDESAIIFSDDGKVADVFLGEPGEDGVPVNDGVIAATVSISAINNSDFCAHVMSELDEVAADIESEQ